MFAKLEEDTKGTESEAEGKNWHHFAVLHKVCCYYLACNSV